MEGDAREVKGQLTERLWGDKKDLEEMGNHWSVVTRVESSSEFMTWKVPV